MSGVFIFTAMALPIFFLDNDETSDFITLPEDTSKHVVQVLRMKVGEQLQLTDGKGNLLTAIVSDDQKKKCTVRVVNRTFTTRNAKEICIAISLLKNASRFEWFLEKATEIGVTEIIPLVSDRTEKQHFRFDRMNHILVAAMLQSQQVWLPVLNKPTLFEKVIAQSKYSTKLIAHCEEEQKRSIKNFSGQPSIQILIGPEGDFSTQEINAAIQANYLPVTLGETRLRTETAGVVAATLVCI
jgi:16S rRNA (uracil1498-N3)-methyltransferase